MEAILVAELGNAKKLGRVRRSKGNNTANGGGVESMVRVVQVQSSWEILELQDLIRPVSTWSAWAT